MAKWGIQGETGSLGQIQVGHNGQTMTQIMTSSASGVQLKNINSLTASYAKITELDVYTINSVQQTESTLEVSDKKIIAAVSGTEGTSDVGLQIGGSATATELAAVLYDGANLDLRLGGSVYATMLASGAGFQVAGALSGSGALQGASVAVDGSIAGAAISGSGAGQFASIHCDSVNLDGGNIDGTVIGAAETAAATFTQMTANGDVVLGTNSGNVIEFNGLCDTDFIPANDSTSDLGSSTKQWAEVHADAGHIDAMTVTGTSTLGVVTATTISGSGAANLASLHCDSVNLDGGNIDGVTIGAASAAAGTFAAVAATTLTGSGAANLASLHCDSVNLDGGNIDGTIIGAASAAAVTATTIAATSLSASSFVSASSFTLGEDSATIDYSTSLDLSLGSTKYAALSTAFFSASVDLQGPNVVTSGSVTAGGSFIIGSADLNETDLEKLDGITDGTGAANKALVLDGSRDVDTINALGIASMANNWTNASRTVADMGTVTTMDLNGGSIDGTTIGAASPSTAVVTTLSGSGAANLASLHCDSVNLDGGNIDGVTIGAASAAAGTFAALVGTTVSGSGAAQFASVHCDSVNLDGGNIDGVTIGGASAAAGTFTTLSGSGAANLASLHCDSVNLDGGNIDGTIIGAASKAAGTFTTLTGDEVTDGMASLAVGTLTGVTQIGTDAAPVTDIYATNLYTGDFHMKNERGDWTLFEESDHIRIRNNVTGQVFKMAMTLVDEE